MSNLILKLLKCIIFLLPTRKGRSVIIVETTETILDAKLVLKCVHKYTYCKQRCRGCTFMPLTIERSFTIDLELVRATGIVFDIN